MRKEMPFGMSAENGGAGIQLGVEGTGAFGRSGAWLDFS
jgi:hypothetical protein